MESNIELEEYEVVKLLKRFYSEEELDEKIKIVNKLDDIFYEVDKISKRHKLLKGLSDIALTKEVVEIASIETKTRFGTDVFVGNSIVKCALIDYKSIHQPTYQNLVNKIYSSEKLARLVLDGYSNGGFSFLLYTLYNDDLKLTEEQKEFAIKEALHKPGTVNSIKKQDKFHDELISKGITDDQPMMTEWGPVGALAGNLYINKIFSGLSDTQAHGVNEYDIRYLILKNKNFQNQTEALLGKFYYSQELYSGYFDTWERDLMNLVPENIYGNHVIYYGDYFELSEEEMIARLINSTAPKECIKEFIEEIRFLKKLKSIRPVMDYNDETMGRVL